MPVSDKLLVHPKQTAQEKRARRRRADGSLFRLVCQLKAARLRAGMSQEQLAYRLRTTKSAVSRLETGLIHRPTLTTIENYAMVVGCRVEVTLVPFSTVLWSPWN